jgi:hypothetical protein
MTSYTRIFDRKNKHTRDQVEESQARLSRALKASKLPLTASPQQQIRALENYIQDLRDLEEELSADYGISELADSLWRVRLEITRSVKQITDLKLETIKPEAI